MRASALLLPSLLVLVAALWAGCGGDDCEAVCGDGRVECGETCDDGNTQGEDGCSASCEVECWDMDGDGFLPIECGGRDCNNRDPLVGPGRAEVCANGLDDDCDPSTPDLLDIDGDGDTCDVDCNDADATVGPSSPELCANEVDDDCDPSTEDIQDADADGHLCTVDCDDQLDFVGPDKSEDCTNGHDDDCNGLADCRDPACNTLPACLDRQGGATGGLHEGRIEVVVIDAWTERPLGGAQVIVARSDEESFSATASPEGVATIEGVRPGAVTLTVRSEGFVVSSVVDVNAKRVVLPLWRQQLTMVQQPVESSALPAELIGGTGFAFSGLGQAVPLMVADDGAGAGVIDADPETPAIDPLRLTAVDQGPLVFDLILRAESGLAYFGYGFVGSAPSAAPRVNLRESLPKTVSGELRVGEDTPFVPLSAGTLRISARAYAGRYGQLDVAEPHRPKPVNGTSATFGVASGDALVLSRMKDVGHYAYVAEIEGSVGLDAITSAIAVRGYFDDLPDQVSFEGFKLPPELLLLDATERQNPAVVWSPEGTPGDTGGFHRIEVFDASETLVWSILGRGGSDGLRLPAAYALEDGKTYRIEVSAHHVPSFNFNRFSLAEMERSVTHWSSRSADYAVK